MVDRRSFLTAAAGVGVTTALPLSAAAAAAEPVAKMRFAMRGLQPVTTVFIGGKGPYLVLLDTGNAVLPSLKSEICETLGLSSNGSVRVYGATGTDREIGYAAHNVVFGQTLIEPDVTFLGLPGKAGVGIDGILPLSLFTARPTDMDFTTGEVRIQLSGSVDRTGFRAIQSERVTQSGGAFIVNAVVDGFPARLVVDTGAGGTVHMFPDFVRRHGLWEKHPRYLEHQFGGVTSGKGVQHEVRVPDVQVGPFKFKDVLIGLADPRLTVESRNFDGLLGIELLRRFTVGFDRGASCVWLKPNDALSDPYLYDHSGLVEKFENGVCTVQALSPGSPSESSGLRVGDRIVGIDTREKLAAFDRRLYGAPDQEIDFEIERGGQRMPIKMVLKDWL